MGQVSATKPEEVTTTEDRGFSVDIRLTGLTSEEKEGMIREIKSEGGVEVDGVYHVSIDDVPDGTTFAGFDHEDDSEG